MPTDTAKVQELLDAAARLSADLRGRFLDKSCGVHGPLRREVDSLLAALDRSPDLLAIAPVQFTPAASGERPGDAIGPYTLVRAIGEGGFGTVYLAEQSRPLRRTAALKVIKLGMDTRQVVARFEAERQALAMLDHPNVARVLDAGATESGRPYFVMELVDGPPLTRYCDDHRLSPRDRVALLVDVCNAIHHAHQRGVLHRDLKPSNVLVAEVDGRPVPKVIDFGVAKAVGQPLGERTLITVDGQWIGTPAYMSPEQFGDGARVDTRSDLFALGVLLYELLTGTTPMRLADGERPGPAEIERRVRAEDPPPLTARLAQLGGALPRVAADRGTTPADLRRAVRGELGWIAAHCLEREPERRYPSVAHLAEDLRRHLAGRPVEVGPAGLSYRARKFARRNRGRITATLLVVLSLAGVAFGLAMRHYYGPDSRSSIRERMDRAAMHFRFGEYAAAEPLYRDVLEKSRRVLGEDDPISVNALVEMISCLNLQDKYDEALVFDARLHDLILRNRINLYWAAELSDWYGGKLWLMGRWLEAEPRLIESLQIQERAGYQGRAKYRNTIQKLADICVRTGRAEAAAAWRARLSPAKPTTRSGL